MTRSAILACRILVGLFPFLALSDGTAEFRTLTLATTDTILILSAGLERPSILSLASPGSTAWKTEQPQQLIDQAQIDGQWESVHWKLAWVKRDPAGNSVTVLYRSSQQHLRLYWAWQARAQIGPIEHTIRIENLENRPVGLPLQDTFSFDWTVPTSQQLRHMWIEKGAGRPSPEGTHEVELKESYHWQGTSSTYARDGPGVPREPIP